MKKRRNSRGFTLAEMLVAILILLMVSVIVATGIPVAKNAYDKVVVGANAQVLLSTAASALRNELGTAQDIEIADGTQVTYLSSETRASAKIYLSTGSEGIMLREYADYTESALVKPRRLVSVSASNKNLYVTYTGIAWTAADSGVLAITGLRVYRTTDNKPLTDPMDLQIRVIGAP